MRVAASYNELYGNIPVSVKDNVQTAPPPYKAEILKYLQDWRTGTVAPKKIMDVVDGKTSIGPVAEHTDGEYIWTSTLIYYFDKYNVPLRDDFVAHVLSKIKQ